MMEGKWLEGEKRHRVPLRFRARFEVQVRNGNECQCSSCCHLGAPLRGSILVRYANWIVFIVLYVMNPFKTSARNDPHVAVTLFEALKPAEG